MGNTSRAFLAVLILMTGGSPLALAGGSGLNVLVVVNQNSTNSVRLGNDYLEVRDVPPANLFRMTNWNGGSQSWTLEEFSTHLRDPMLGHIAANGLSNQIHYVLLSMDIPYRVRSGGSENSTTSVLFYGFKTNTMPDQPGLPVSCSKPPDAMSSYAFSELAWPEGAPTNSAGPSFLATMLTARTFEQARATLLRAAAGDGSAPAAPVFLAKTSDAARNVRYLDFENAAFEARVWGDDALVITNTDSTAFNGLRGIQTGLFAFTIPPDSLLPGALADSLTSFAGAIFESPTGTMLSFLEGGAAATYGTVVEPCNVNAKFPNPLLYYYQDRGFSAAESYYQSLGMPFQGMVLGEPLSAPFARQGSPGKLTYTNGLELADGAVLSGIAPLNFTLYGPDLSTPLAAADLFVDGLFFTNLARLGPAADNRLRVSVDDFGIDYTVRAGATLATASKGLSDAINTRSIVTGVQAWPIGDRILLRAIAPGISGTAPSLSARASQGFASRSTTFLRAAQSVFAPSPATGFFGMAVSNSPVAGDWLALRFIKTNGQAVIVGVTNQVTSMFMSDFARLLISKVNATPDLQGPDGVRAGDLYPYAEDRAAYFIAYARTPGWEAAQIQIRLDGSPGLLVLAFGERLLDNEMDLLPRNHLYLGSGTVLLGAACALDTRRLADGWHEFTGVATEGNSVRTQTRVSRNVRVKNTSLEADLRLLSASSPIEIPLQVEVEANSTDISQIELFSTGGRVGAVSNQSLARFNIPLAPLGLGRHEFYALVTRADGAQYRTGSIQTRVVPGARLSITGPPWLLSWNAKPGRTYDILASTNARDFSSAMTVTATNTLGLWRAPSNSAQAVFYRLRTRE